MTFVIAIALFMFGTDRSGPEVRLIVVEPAETISVSLQGTGQPVVLIPGMLGGAYSYRKVASAVSGRTLIIDPLGMGGSSRPRNADYSMQAQAERVAAVLDSLDVPRALVVGHESGVPVALRLALLRPGLVSGIIAVNGSASEKFQNGGLKMAVRLAPILKLFGGARKAEQRVLGGMREHSADTAWITSDVVTAYVSPYRDDLGGTLRVLNAITSAKEPFPLLPRLAQLRVPVVLLLGTGARKPSAKAEEVAAFRAALPALRVRSLPTVGAFIQEEEPALLVQAIEELL